MRISTAVISLSALLTAACTSSTEKDAGNAQSDFEACVKQALSGTKLINVFVANNPADSFRVSGELPESKGEIEWQDNKIEANVTSLMVFTPNSVTVTDTKRSLKVPVRPEVSETELDPTGGMQRDVDISAVYPQIKACAANALKPA